MLQQEAGHHQPHLLSACLSSQNKFTKINLTPRVLFFDQPTIISIEQIIALKDHPENRLQVLMFGDRAGPLRLADEEKENKMDIKVSRIEFNTILAALRFWQETVIADEENRSDLFQAIVCPANDETILDEADFDKLWERINCHQGPKGKTMYEQTETLGMQAEGPRTHYYLVTIWGDVEAEKLGPYPTAEARDAAARAFMREEGDAHGIHPLDITTTSEGLVEVEVGDYCGGCLMDDADNAGGREKEMSSEEMSSEITIRRFISSGELNNFHKNTLTLLREAGVMMDRACGDLFGPVFFECADGRIYTLTLGAIIDEVDLEYVNDVLSE